MMKALNCELNSSVKSPFVAVCTALATSEYEVQAERSISVYCFVTPSTSKVIEPLEIAVMVLNAVLTSNSAPLTHALDAVE